jgi:XTP/dITP diphosphohydrolase
MRAMNVMTIASLNRGKQAEFRDLLAKHNLKLATLDQFVRNFTFLEHVESEERAATYYDNAFRKCLAAFRAAKVPTFADDSGIEIDALNGEPGVHAANFGKPGARESRDEANRRKVLELLKGKSDRRARFRCTLVLMVEGLVLKAEGVCEGTIAEKESGSGGFGYDPIFLPEGGGGKTFAELSPEEKNRLSHRAKAVESLVKLMQEREVQLVRP